MDLFSWTEELRTGVSELDEQHRYMIGLVNDLHIAAENQRESASDVLSFLLAYVKVHLETEEKLMEESAFPGIDEHRMEHDGLRRNVLRILEGAEPGCAIGVDLPKYLSDWLKGHIMATDMKMAQHLRLQSPA